MTIDAIEIVDFPIENGDFPVRYVSLPEGKWWLDFQAKGRLRPEAQLKVLRIILRSSGVSARPKGPNLSEAHVIYPLVNIQKAIENGHW